MSSRVRFTLDLFKPFTFKEAQLPVLVWLWARKHKHKVVFLADDSKNPQSESSLEPMLHALRALQLSWIEGPDIGGKSGPYVRSLRTKIYQSWIPKLLKCDSVFACYCPKTEPKCLEVGTENKLLPKSGENACTYRLRVPNLEETPLLLADNLKPTQLFMNCVDDHEMDFQEACRWEHEKNSCEAQQFLTEALSMKCPTFLYLHATDWQLLSPEWQDVMILLESGYTAEMIWNVLTFRPCSETPDSELCKTMPELIKLFDLGIFQQRCRPLTEEDWKRLSHALLVKTSDRILAKAAIPYLKKSGHFRGHVREDELQALEEQVSRWKPKSQTLRDLFEHLSKDEKHE